jgi:hypothetical protein
MMFATKICMNSGCEESDDLLDIHSIYIVGYIEDKFMTKEEVHHYLREHPHSIKVDVFPYSFLIPVVGPNGEKYVQSTADESGRDILLQLPRE